MIIWRPIQAALDRGELKDGNGFLAYGRHVSDDGRPGRYKQGDHWWAIILWDIWREPAQWVFAKTGEPLSMWGNPLAYTDLDVPGIDVMHGLEPGRPMPDPWAASK